MKRSGKRLGGLLAMGLLLASLWSPGPTHADPVPDPVIAWNVIMRAALPMATSNGFLQTRSATMMHLAMFEAVNAIVEDYTPYLKTLNAPLGASPEAAAIAAAHRTLVRLHPVLTASLDAARDSALAAIPDGPAKAGGFAVGVAAADAIVAHRANDGAVDAGIPPYIPGTAPGDWRPTPPALADALFPHWGKVPTFGIQYGAQFRANPPPAMWNSTYARDYNEVKAMGAVNSAVRPPDKTDIARFYGVNLPGYVFNEVAIQASVAQGKSLAENARIFALLQMAITDRLISSMESKFYYETWRPVTAIRAGDTDGNARTAPDPAWLPLVTTPPYPSYPSNYASAANAAHAVLKKVYGNSGHAITLPSGAPAVAVTLHYTRFSQMTEDINDARVYGGIHFRFDQDAGSHMGWQIGSYIVRNQLRPAHDQH